MTLNASPNSLYLYEREGAYIPRVGAVHDLCGYGKCSLGVAIPVLSAAGCDVCPVPTGLFSAHTAFPKFYLYSTTPMLTPYLDAWVEEGVALDAVYSGFLGSPQDIEAIQRLYREHESALRVVDPVMGDGGKAYPTYTPELCEAMKELVTGADILTPNLTEVSILTGTEYQGQNVDEAFVREAADRLIDMGAKTVVIKGVERGDGLIRNYVGGAGLELTEVSGEKLPFMLHGTGDLFTSALLASVMTGHSLEDAVRFAGRFVHDCMKLSAEQPDHQLRGVSFESKLGDVTALLG